jgi:hypothetical protein
MKTNGRYVPTGMALVWLVASVCTHQPVRAQPAVIELPLTPVDIDDDDNNSVSDRNQSVFSGALRGDWVAVPPTSAPGGTTVVPPSLRVWVHHKLKPTSQLSNSQEWLVQGTQAGRFLVTKGTQSFRIRMIESQWFDGQGQALDATNTGVNVARVPPQSTQGNPLAKHADDAGYRLVLRADPQDIPKEVELRSLTEQGTILDSFKHLSLTKVPCPFAEIRPGLQCVSSQPIRMVLDEIDRDHPSGKNKSILAQLAGAIQARAGEQKLTMVRVVAPEQRGVQVYKRLRANLRLLLVRASAKSGPPFGQNDAQAISLVRTQVERANALWGQCGISFGDPNKVSIKIVDPPKANMVAIGCDLGQPSNGHSQIQLKVDGKTVSLALKPAESPHEVASRLALVFQKKGFVPVLSRNKRIGPASYPTVDIMVYRKNKQPAHVEMPPKGPISNDSNLSVCIGNVNLNDGLQHFSDIDAVAGTVEERALLKAFDDGDPQTIEVLFIPSFATGGRIGESFIFGDRSSLANMVVEDRAGIRADRVSFALAHELGHVLMDVPGHSDDFGADTPTRLMDSDAADPTALGPRRLTLDECKQAWLQSGPKAPAPLLVSWPLAAIKTAVVPQNRKQKLHLTYRNY